jgi:hypothetical protein
MNTNFTQSPWAIPEVFKAKNYLQENSESFLQPFIFLYLYISTIYEIFEKEKSGVILFIVSSDFVQ